VMQWSNDLGW